MFENILVVCVGNICRSPTGERLLRQHLPEKRIESAGVSAVVGAEAYRRSQEVAESNGLSLVGHCARQLTPEIASEFDLILVMEKKHMDTVARISPSARSKTMLFGQWLSTTDKDIPDPYGESDEMFIQVYKQMAESAELWADKLRATKA